MKNKNKSNESELLDLLKGLNEKEINGVFSVLDDLVKSEKGSKLDALYKADYRQIPATPEEFVNLEEYALHAGKELYPIWRQEFIDIYNNSNIYHIVLTGAIGIGKDYFTELLLAYELHKIACLRDPHAYFGIAQHTDIVISLISITKAQTKNVLFNQLKTLMDGSPWFDKHFPRNKDKNDTIEFYSPADDGTGRYGRIRVMYGAPNNASVIGENVITAAMDEANFMEVIEKSKKVRGINKQFNQAQIVYDNILRRMKSRYLMQGKMAGKLILLSSRQYPDDFVEKKIAEYKDDKNVKICAYSLYGMKPWRYSQTEFFWVLIGNKQVTSRIMLDEAELDNLNDQERECKIEKVPIDFLADFKRDLDGSVRDICGEATLTVSSFLKQRSKLFSCIRKDLINLCIGNICTTDFTEGAVLDEDKIEFIKNKHIPRAIHLDLSTSGDPTGFAMCHVSGLREVEHNVLIKDVLAGDRIQKVTEMLPVFRTDLMLEITPPENSEIKLSLVRQLIHDLREYGFNIAIVTADQYQSQDTLQILSDNGFETADLSVDRSRKPYDNLKFAVYEDRFECYDNDIFIDEMIHLEDDIKKKKIDHKIGGKKDLADAVAGACWSLAELQLWDDLGTLTPSKGYSEEPKKDRVTEGNSAEESCEIFVNEFTNDVLSGKINKEPTLTFEEMLIKRS